MFVGVPNPNILVPVQKMRITNLDAKSPPKSIEVLYNPQSYTRKKSANYTNCCTDVFFHFHHSNTLTFLINGCVLLLLPAHAR